MRQIPDGPPQRPGARRRADEINPYTLVRAALWFTVVLNAVGFVIFCRLALGHSSALMPVPASPYLAALTALTIGLFAGVYLWQAVATRLNRAVIVVGALGKLAFFLITLAFCVTGALPVRVAVNASPDLVLAVIFLAWAFASTGEIVSGRAA